MSRPGHAARALLGGDDAVHVFATDREAFAYELRMPGATTIAPRSRAGGWRALLSELDGAPLATVRDRQVVIELASDADEGTKQVVRQLGALLVRRGALEVRCWGRKVA